MPKDFISIGCDAGGKEAGVVAFLCVPLRHSLSTHVKSTHCEAVDQYAIVLRIDGSVCKFGPEGFYRLRFAKAKRYITLDIQIPESVWQQKNTVELKSYLVKQITMAIQKCVERLKKEKNHVDVEVLLSEINNATTEYLANK